MSFIVFLRRPNLFFKLFVMRHLKNAATNHFLLVILLLPLLTYCVNTTGPLVKIPTDFSSPIGTSHFSPGISHVDTTLNYPWDNNDPTAVKNVKSLIKHAIAYENTPIMAWGVDDPWPDPSQAEPGNWSTLDSRLQLIIDTGGIPVITLSEAPWWMKGELQSDGSTRLIMHSEEWSNIAYSARILDNKMDAWLHLVQRVAERYMVAPYNVRYFQVWNELKGYYNPITNSYDYTTSAGDPSGPNAKHGYTYMYNQTYGQRPLDVVQYWLQHKAGAGFITVDGDNGNKDGVNITDPFTASEKFADITHWIRSLNNDIYPGAATLPIWWAEWSAWPYTNLADDNYNNAIKSYAMIMFLEAGGSVALSWGGLGDGTASKGLWTTTATGGGQPLPWYYSSSSSSSRLWYRFSATSVDVLDNSR